MSPKNKNLKRITAKQIGGNDGYCWCVLIDGIVFVDGLTRSQVAYYKKVALERLEPKKPIEVESVRVINSNKE